MGVYNQWTGLVDWTTGLIDKRTEMLHNVTQSTATCAVAWATQLPTQVQMCSFIAQSSILQTT
jgi:hypothetical protein